MSLDAAIELRAGTTPLLFSSASGLRDAMLEALIEGRVYGRAIVRVGHDASEPAWSFLDRLLAQRSDWAAAVERAVGALIVDPDPFVRSALDGWLGLERGALQLSEAMLAGLGGPLADRVLQARVELRDPERWAHLEGPLGPRVAALPLRNREELAVALDRAAMRGRDVRHGWGDGPAAFLHQEVAARPWLDDALVEVCEAMLAGSPPERALVLEWWADERDLWRHAGSIDAALSGNAPWLDAPLGRKPKGWQRPPKPARWPMTRTVRDALFRLQRLARGQLATPAVLDLDAPGFA